MREANISASFDKIYERIGLGPLDSPKLQSAPFGWEDLQFFLAVAKWKSFNAAANHLHVSQPTVAKAVDRLQDLIGAPLVERSNTGVVLTLRGQELASHLVHLDEELFARLREIRSDKASIAGLVRVAATEGLAGVFIVDAMEDLESRYPHINLHLKNPVNILGFRENQADIVLGYATPEHDGVTSRPAGTLHLVPMASRGYVSRYGAPTIETLRQHRVVDAGYYQSDNDTWRPWRAIVEDAGRVHLCDNTINHARMIRSGRGVGLTGGHLLTDPEMVGVDLGVHVKLPLYLNASTERLKTKSVKAVFDFLSEIFTPAKPWFSPDFLSDQMPSDRFNGVYSQYFGLRKLKDPYGS